MVKLLQQKVLRKFLILLFFLPAVSVWGQSFSGAFTFSGGNDVITLPYGGTAVQNLTVSNLTKNGVSSTSSTSAFRADGWPTAAAFDNGKYFEFTITAATGYTISNPSLSFGMGRSGTGPRNFQWRSNVDNYVAAIPVTTMGSNGTNNSNTINVTDANANWTGYVVSLTTSNKTSITFRFYANAAEGGAGTGGLYSSLAFSGTLTAVPTAPSFPTGAASQTFTYGTGGTYNYTVAGMPAPTITTTLNPSGSLPTGITAGTNSIIVAANTPAGTYNIRINANNSEGSPNKDVTITVNKANQTIANFSNIIKTYGDADFTLSATGGASGEPITYVSSDTNVATISGNTVTVISAGTSTITASQAGNANYNAATNVLRTLTVNRANQTISNFTNIAKVVGDADFTLSAIGGASGEPITYTSSDTNVATISGNTVTIVGAGTSTITASQAGTTNYNPASLGVTLTVSKLTQAITTFTDISKTYGDADFTLSATGGASGEPVTYVSSNTAVATISGNTVTILSNGTTNITASQAGNTTYDAAADVVRALTVAVKPITITGLTANDKVYDRNMTAILSGAGLTASEIVGSDDVALGTYTATFTDETVADNKTVTVTYQLTGNEAGKYALTQPTGIVADITAKELTISGLQADNKTYDGTTAATLTGTPLVNGVISPDVVSLTGTGSAVFNDPNVGAAIPVTVTGYSITGTDVANYTLQQPQGLTANITSITLQNQTITFNTLSNVAYGDADFNLSAAASSGLTVTYTSSDTSVATVSGNTVTILEPGITTITANQTGDSSYNPAPAVQQQLTVTSKTITVSNAAIADKTYDQTTTAVASGTLTGVINSDSVTLTSAATFTTDDAGNNIAVTPQYSITGTDVAKYTLTQPTVTGNILPATLTLTGATASNKVYDTTANAVVNGTLTGILSGDDVTLNGTGIFTDTNVGTAIDVTSTSTLSGTDASNYTLTQPTGLTANITSVALTVNASVSDKVYNRNTDAVINVSQINGLASGDDVTVTGGGTFNNFNVGTNKPVTANLSLTGADAANYTLTQPTGLTAAITAKALTVDTANTTVATKTYNKTTTATLSNVTLTGVEAGDELNVTATGGTFAQTTPGTGIAVTNLALSGSAATNYTLTQPTTLTGTIVPKQLTITGAVAPNKIYDGTTNAIIQGALTGVETGDIVTLNGTGTFASPNVAAVGIAVTSTSTLGGADAANYTLQQPAGLSGMINAKPLTITATAHDKVYDRTTAAIVDNAVLDISGIVSGDDVALASTTGTATFANAAVGNNKTVTANFTLQGTSASNYSVSAQTYQASITPLTISADITASTVTTKTYNATTGAVINGALLNGVITGDTVTLSGSFASANVGAGIPVTLLLTGQSAPNYTLTQPTPGLSGEIIKKTLIATANNLTKTQGDTNPTLTVSYNGFEGGQTDTSAAGFVAPAMTTTATATSPAGAYPITITGGAADNYTISLVNGWMIVVPPVNTVFTPGTLWSNPINDGAPNNFNPFILGESIPASTYITVSGIGRGSGIGGNGAANRYNANNWNSTFDSNDYFYFTISAKSGYKINFTNFVYSGQASGTGPSTVVIRSSADNYTSNIGSPTIGGTTINLSGAAYQNLTGSITFRVYAYGASMTSGTFSINDFSFSGSVIEIPVTTAPQITSTLAANSFVGDSEMYQITASGTPEIALTATNLPTGATTDANGLITFDGTTPAGVYNINLKASGYYGTDNEVLVYTVDKLDQYLTFTPDPIPNKFANDLPFQVTVTNSAPLAVTYSSSDTNVATIAQDGTITIVGPGLTTITASNSGDATYNPVSLGKNFTVLPTPQITATPAAMSFTAIQGQGASAATQITSVNGINLVPVADNITFTTSAGFELAMGVGAFGITGSIAYTGGTVNLTNPQIFVRFAAGQAVGTYNGTLTISGGNGSVQIPLTAVVDPAPAINTTVAAFGPYCSGSENSISVAYTTQGTFGAGNYYVQHSDATGVFPTDFSNVISASATASPISATLPSSLTAGNYKIRVIHLSSSLALTASLNDNGSNIVINTTPAPTATALTFCNSATVANLTTTGTSLKWYAAANGGTALASTDAVTTGNYFVSQTLNNCESARTQVVVTVNVTPVPTATALTFCNSATVANLTATGTSLKWYAAANGGTALASTDAVTTGNYFVSQTLNNCESARTQVAVTVNVTPAPTATALTFCNSATVVNLTATGASLKWYAAANGGTALASTDVVTTGNYFVSQTLNNCESARTQVAVTVNVTPAPTATALTFCNSATVANLTATGASLKWYAAANGGTALVSTDVVTTGNYFVSQTLNNCESARTQVTVTVNVTPAPTATALTFCNSATVANLTASGTSLKWYAAANGGTALASTDAVTTGNYFVSQTLNNCESTRTQVAVIVNVTPAPTATALTFINSATVADLTASGVNIKWYSAANGGTQLSSTDEVTTGSYFVSQTLNNCESTRTEVQVTITIVNPAPPAPVALDAEFCNTATIGQLIAEGIDLKWYSAPTGGVALPTSTVIATGVYYVTQTVNGLESDRTEVNVTINVTPAPVATALTFCHAATVADLTASGENLKWYTTENGGTELAQNTALATGNYYVSQSLNGCESTRAHIVVTLTSTPMPGATNQTFCNGATIAELSATVTGSELKVYSSLTATDVLDGTSIITTGNYYVSQTFNGCESLRREIQVTITSTPAPTGNTQQEFTGDNHTIAELQADGQDIKWYASEEDAIAGINPLSETIVLVSETTYYATQTVDGCESNEVLAVTVEIVLGRDEMEKFSFSYFPNPVIDNLQINADETITNVKVYSLTGWLVMDKQMNAQTSTLNMSHLESGIYIVKVSFGEIEKTIRIVREK